MVKEIPLTRGRIAIVDDFDYHWLSQVKWHFLTRGYAGHVRGGRKNKEHILMHRLILLAPDTCTVDHINHDTLDNRRSNLRLATQSQQNANRRKISGSSKYKGVYPRRDGLKWCAQLGAFGAKTYLGSFNTEEEAALVYNNAAIVAFGEFALLNQI